MNDNLESLKEVLTQIKKEVQKVIIGQDEVIEKCLVTILTGQHALIEGVPGIAKTLLVRTLAHVLGCDFNRIQFTPDLMPSDIIGTNIFNLKQNEFTLVKGPIFTTFLLGDEINRAPAKTQSAMLQAMQERMVTIDGTTYPLSLNFTVFATQNPIEYEGTYPLPEAQKDRFLFKIPIYFPTRQEEVILAKSMLGEDCPEAILNKSGVLQTIDFNLPTLKKCLEQFPVREELIGYVVDIVSKTRTHESILSGAGPRATQALVLASRAYAALQNRDFVTPDDIKALAHPVLVHRLILRPEFEIEGVTVTEVIDDILKEVPVPR